MVYHMFISPLTCNDIASSVLLTMSCSPVDGVMVLPSGFGALGSTTGAAINNSNLQVQVSWKFESNRPPLKFDKFKAETVKVLESMYFASKK